MQYEDVRRNDLRHRPGLLRCAAFAQPEHGPPSVMVSYADLNLADPAGRETLNRRINAAVRRVCSEAARGAHHGRSPRRNCSAAAHADADRQLMTPGRGQHARGAIQVRAPR